MLQCVNFSAFSMSQSDAYHMNWETVWAMCKARRFMQVSTVDDFFSQVHCWIASKKVFQNLCRRVQKLFIFCTNNKSQLAFVIPTGVPGEAVPSISRYAQSCYGGLAEVLFRCGTLFRRAERSLFAQRHVKMISFFSRPWHPSAFHIFETICSAPIGPNYMIFV